MSDGDHSNLLQFAPFTSALDAGFWHQLAQKKLDVYKLDDKCITVCGFYSNREPNIRLPIANIDYTSFNEDLQVPPMSYPLRGSLVNTNTLEEFKLKDKKELLQFAGQEIWELIKSKKVLEDPSLLQKFLCLTFADLKKFHYYYWIAFPAFLYPEVLNCHEPKKIHEYFNDNQIVQLLSGIEALPRNDQMVFLVHSSEDGTISTLKLADYDSVCDSSEKVILGFADPCTLATHPGWPLRNFLSAVAYYWGTRNQKWDVICLRICYKDGKLDASHSIVLSIELQNVNIPQECPKTVGWEKNKNKLIPRMVDMSSSMDPTKLADAAVDLNLKLMRWRLVPELELDAIKNTKCLLLGSGTLGCNVARCLLGWGVRKITFVDNSQVSFSNPVRQTLFQFGDCLNGGKAKAEAAADALKRIFPGVISEGKQLNIPMPGHSLSHNLLENTRKEVVELEKLIDEHDVIFLLMDTRESRWLPTVIGKAKSKIVINAALGFDTFLVMRHGVQNYTASATESDIDWKIVCGSKLGCYFCNDVVAPGNSTRDRTLDQQCTVTRPGVSYMAAAFAVELMVGVLQHPLRGNAPAVADIQHDVHNESITPLGIIPHQIRGYMDRFQNFLHVSKAFDRCTACSSKVLEEYTSNGFDFLVKAFNDSDYLESLTGLTDLLQNLDINDVLELSDNESI